MSAPARSRGASPTPSRPWGILDVRCVRVACGADERCPRCGRGLGCGAWGLWACFCWPTSEGRGAQRTIKLLVRLSVLLSTVYMCTFILDDCAWTILVDLEVRRYLSKHEWKNSRTKQCRAWLQDAGALPSQKGLCAEIASSSWQSRGFAGDLMQSHTGGPESAECQRAHSKRAHKLCVAACTSVHAHAHAYITSESASYTPSVRLDRFAATGHLYSCDDVRLT